MRFFFFFRKLAVSLRILDTSPPKLLRSIGIPLPLCFFPDRKEGEGLRPLMDWLTELLESDESAVAALLVEGCVVAKGVDSKV